jgi:cellobiose phosphorylase
MYTLILESLLGVRRSGEIITFMPCIPVTWRSYRIDYRYRSTSYHIVVQNSGTGSGVKSIVVDGIDQADKTIQLADDRGDHQVVVELGE